jgi:N-acyl-D-aspartate/D-glutamate deacylase
MDSLERIPKGVNVMSYIPIAPLMIYVMGIEAAKTRAGTSEERRRMRELFNQAMDAGACGFSVQFTGAWNIQRDYDGTPMVTDVMSKDDLMMFAEILRERGEGYIQANCAPEIAEELAELSGRPLIWNVLGIGTDQHGGEIPPHKAVLEWVRDANARGNRIFTQTVSTTGEAAFTLEDWNLFDQNEVWREVTLGNVEERMKKMSDPSAREILRRDHDRRRGHISGKLQSDWGKLAANTNVSDEDPGHIITPRLGQFRITECVLEKNKQYDGMTVADYAVAVNKHPIDAFLDLAVEEGLKTQFEHEALSSLDDPGYGEILRGPQSLPGISDGGAHTKFISLGRFTTEFLTEHIRKRHVMSLEEAHWRLSGYPAYAAGIKDRGFIREGAPADIVVYDYEALKVFPVEIAHDYPGNEWRRIQKAHGYRFILVNGEVTFKDGECTGATPGHLLRHGYAASPTTISARAAA